jgi:hypothetical protein
LIRKLLPLLSSAMMINSALSCGHRFVGALVLGDIMPSVLMEQPRKTARPERHLRQWPAQVKRTKQHE